MGSRWFIILIDVVDASQRGSGLGVWSREVTLEEWMALGQSCPGAGFPVRCLPYLDCLLPIRRCAIVDGVKEKAPDSILVVSESWRTQVLLAAQLAEDLGRDVISASDVTQALGLIKLGGIDPVVLLVDAGQGISAGDVRRLTEAKRHTPLVLVVSRPRRQAFETLRGVSAAYLVRPVSVGEISRSVRRLLKGATEQ